MVLLQPTSANVFDNLRFVAASARSPLDELSAYLAAATEVPEGGDALKWWKRNTSTFPHLSRMALDYLSIPATSVDVERTFSRGRLLLSHVRNRLSAESTRALLCIGSWLNCGMVKISDIRSVTTEVEVAAGEVEELEADWAKIGV
ncbi:hATC-domain-containing protein [Auricularia subglabra TFB-10046 SS5]|uniref:HATC-domain-containing protein n=1 Tax=Auricularia subglabra (strain TFB-10046 / SS5) TaxID=717982 RepID=J0WKU6_AURST|nr:hATC-domain-containing protein [Auricularia subglabra TFB-10046 SS5]EJD32558.1 hATC-domain-containing protein [Auricularia subglabra TFB-10046 SS5]